MKRTRLLLILAVLIALCAAGAWYVWSPRSVPPGQPPLATLEPGTLQHLGADFNRDSDNIRVVVLLSPT